MWRSTFIGPTGLGRREAYRQRPSFLIWRYEVICDIWIGVSVLEIPFCLVGTESMDLARLCPRFYYPIIQGKGVWFFALQQRGMLRPGLIPLLEHLRDIGATVVVGSCKHNVSELRAQIFTIIWAKHIACTNQVYTHSELRWATKVCAAIEEVVGFSFIKRLFSRYLIHCLPNALKRKLFESSCMLCFFLVHGKYWSVWNMFLDASMCFLRRRGTMFVPSL